jgi:hypothetical protein
MPGLARNCRKKVVSGLAGRGLACRGLACRGWAARDGAAAGAVEDAVVMVWFQGLPYVALVRGLEGIFDLDF